MCTYMYVNVNGTSYTTLPPDLVTSLARVVGDIASDVESFLNTLESTADGRRTWVCIHIVCVYVHVCRVHTS